MEWLILYTESDDDWSQHRGGDKTHPLQSEYEVQTYRQCVGVLGFAKKYGKKVLEECCRQALGLNKVTYTFIKNSIPAIAEELTDHTEVSRRNEDKNKGAYVMSSASADINRLLAKSQSLVEQAQKGGRHDENR